MDYFRALLRRQEFSARALDLTTDILNENPSHYAVWCGWRGRRRTLPGRAGLTPGGVPPLSPPSATQWFRQYRREILAALGTPLSDELAFVNALTLETPKNYQLWYALMRPRARALSTLMGPSPRALAVAPVFSGASRYHRQVIVDKLGVAVGEPELVARVLAQDGKNYHAWTYRYPRMAARTAGPSPPACSPGNLGAGDYAPSLAAQAMDARAFPGSVVV